MHAKKFAQSLVLGGHSLKITYLDQVLCKDSLYDLDKYFKIMIFSSAAFLLWGFSTDSLYLRNANIYKIFRRLKF